MNKDGDLVVTDEGVSDKRLLAIEGEFAGLLKVMSREGHTLSAIVRQAWDGGRLQTLTRNSPLKATNPHVCIIGHVTKDEVLRHLSETDASNGFANRFLWIMVKRSRVLPFGGEWSKMNAAPLVKRLSGALEFARSVGELGWGETARSRPRSAKGFRRARPVSSGRRRAGRRRRSSGFRPFTPRWGPRSYHRGGPPEGRACRVGLRRGIGAVHLRGRDGDPVAGRIMDALREKGPEGMSRTEITHLFGRHRSAARIEVSLSALEKRGRVGSETRTTGGRPVERWFAK